MKFYILTLFLIVWQLNFAQPSVIIQGTYQGKNLFVQNPENADGDGLCVIRVEVNGEAFDNLLLSETFEIQFDQLGVKLGDPLEVIIYHHSGCVPKVLNGGLDTPKHLRINSGSIQNGSLRWKDELDEGFTYSIEQYRWNKWITLDLTINDLNDEGYFTADVSSDLHSGVNTFRIVAKNSNDVKAYSNNFNLDGDSEPVSYVLTSDYGLLQFTSETGYELYDEDGALLKSGISDEILLQEFPSGTYFLNFDNYNSKLKLK